MGVTRAARARAERILTGPASVALVSLGALTLPGCAPEPAGSQGAGLDGTLAASAAARSGSDRMEPAASERVPESWHLGRAATEADVRAVDIDVMPDGRGLPPGSGDHATGAALYVTSCAPCHGPAGEGTPLAGPLVDRDPESGFRRRTVGHYWPYATTAFDYIRRSMPWDAPGTLSDDEVYALVAWILAENGVIGRADVMDATTLPAVAMPARDRFVPDDRRGGSVVR